MRAARAWTMRYAGHLGLRAPDEPLFRWSARSADPVDQIGFLAEQGFAGVQDSFTKLRPVAEQERIGREMRRLGLAMGCFTNNPLAWNKPLWSSRAADARAMLKRDLSSSIDAARRVGGSVATCVTGLDDQAPRDRQIAGMIDNLKELAEPAAAAGLVLGIEAVARAWIPGLLVDRIEDALFIVKSVGHPAVRLTFDIAHIEMSGDDGLAWLERCWDWIVAVQLADMPAEGLGRIDLGAGRLDWPAILRCISERGWSGLLELEHMPMEESAAGEEKLLERLRAVDAAV